MNQEKIYKAVETLLILPVALICWLWEAAGIFLAWLKGKILQRTAGIDWEAVISQITCAAAGAAGFVLWSVCGLGEDIWNILVRKGAINENVVC